jgi:hypothetical protein
MFRRPQPTAAAPSGTVELAPHDTCVRCGRPTPLGVALCERDNPGQIKGPSATQVHGTILLGVIGGFVLLALLFRLATSGSGPFNAAVSGFATRQDGSLELVMQVTNTGSRPAAASCRLSVAGTPNARDVIFLTETIPAGESREFTRIVAAAARGAAGQPAAPQVRCS